MRKIIYGFFICILCWVIFTCVGYFLIDIDDRDTIGRFEIRDRHGTILADIGLPGGYSIPYGGSLTNKLIRSIIEIEDNRYEEHFGVDVLGKLGALRDNITRGEIVRGGSTLTEQLVKNILYPDRDRSFLQKIEEASVAWIISLKYSKDEVLRKYLDTVYMGNGVYGIQSAIDLYFGGRDASTLTRDEIIEIVTRIRYPNIGIRGENYAKTVSKRLFGTEEVIVFTGEIRRKNTNLYPHVTERIEEEKKQYCRGRENTLIKFVTLVPPDICTTSSISLVTTLDAKLMKKAEDTLEGVLIGLTDEGVENGAIYVLDPRREKVLAYIGNRNRKGSDNAIDMITVRRSVGSVLKPFLYKKALENGADGESIIMDDTRIYDTGESGKQFVPENYIPRSYGPVRLKEALGNSLNSATVRLGESIGIGTIYDTYQKSGLDLDHDASYYGYGIALGGPELTLENIVHGYQSLLRLDLLADFLLYDILSDRENRSKTFGITSVLNTSLPLAVKTGTSTDFRDNWTIGYHPDAIIGVWVGNTDNTPMQDVSGVSGAGPIYRQIGEYMIAEGMITPYNISPPEGVELVSVCLDKNCLRKEDAYRRKNMTNISRIADDIYSLSEFITPLTDEEREKWKIGK